MTEVYDEASRRDLVLGVLRCTCLRLKLIENEILTICTALRGGFISPDTALECAEEEAPGCIGFILETISTTGEAA